MSIVSGYQGKRRVHLENLEKLWREILIKIMENGMNPGKTMWALNVSPDP